jgi:dihydrofolate reductase
VIISLIVAMDEKRGIGKAGKLPWRLSSDLKRFKELTMGHHLIVGRKTFESIGKPLPGRQMIVVTRNAVSVRRLSGVRFGSRRPQPGPGAR